MDNDTLIDNAIQIPLTKGFIALISIEDADLAAFNWYAHSNKSMFYARRRGHPPSEPIALFIHKVVLERVICRSLKLGEFCDHINGNTLDNRRCNLRVASHSENMRNRKIGKNNTTGYRGISRDSNGKYRAVIYLDGRKISIGRYSSARAAAIAYNKAALEFYGEFAKLNIIED